MTKAGVGSAFMIFDVLCLLGAQCGEDGGVGLSLSTFTGGGLCFLGWGQTICLGFFPCGCKETLLPEYVVISEELWCLLCPQRVFNKGKSQFLKLKKKKKTTLPLQFP